MRFPPVDGLTSKNHLMEVAYRLGQEGYLETVRGRNGGLRLGKAPDRIVVGAADPRVETDRQVRLGAPRHPATLSQSVPSQVEQQKKRKRLYLP
jgi:DNA-binding IscR family transcriptional regulator